MWQWLFWHCSHQTPEIFPGALIWGCSSTCARSFSQQFGFNWVLQNLVMEFLGKTSGAFTVLPQWGKLQREENGGNSPESTKAFTGCPLTLQLIYSITTWPKLSGASSIAIVIFSSMFCCLNLTEKREKNQTFHQPNLISIPPTYKQTWQSHPLQLTLQTARLNHNKDCSVT